jgi:DMSO/TMAO reductase YedYZ heme-binding membrane subunit
LLAVRIRFGPVQTYNGGCRCRVGEDCLLRGLPVSSEPLSKSARPTARPSAGRTVAWGLLAVFALSFAANWVYADDHLVQQRVGELQGHLALVCLGLTLAARPLSRRIPGLLGERRLLGLLTFAFSVEHTWSTIVHVLGGSLDGMFFLPLDLQLGVMLGVFALLAMVPLALTSNDFSVRLLGHAWKSLHLGVFFAAILMVLHTLGTGVHYVLVARTPLTVAASLSLIGASLWVWRLRREKHT